MSPTTSMTALAPAPPSRPHTTPTLARLVRVELRKAVDTRSGRWLLGVTALLVVAADVLLLLFAEPAEQDFRNFLQIAQLPPALLLPVIGILAVTSEWSQRTALTTFALVPRRSRVVAAKMAAAVLLALLTVAVTVGAAAATNLAAPLVDGSGSWDVGGSLIARLVLVQVVNVLVGVGFGLLLLNSAVAIVLFFLIPTLVTVVTGFVGPLEGAGPWIDINQASAPVTEVREPTGEQWAQYGTASLLWAAVPLVLGTLRVQRREVS